MLIEKFHDVFGKLAVGLVGSGSECYGFDDEISRDHDFEPGFCIFIPDESEIDRRKEFLLERAYDSLPKEYLGLKRSLISPVGGSRHGVKRISDFYFEKTGSADGELTADEWFRLPEYALFEATNGEVFVDGYGLFTAIRGKLSRYPEDVFLKKLAGNILLMAQSGQYNYPRCVRHCEPGAAQFAVFEFVKSCMQAVFLLNKRYMPYYKWSFRAMKELPVFSELSGKLEYLIGTPNDGGLPEKKSEIIESISSAIIAYLVSSGLSGVSSDDLERHAYSVNDRITDPNIRNLHILYAV
ncbi:MAG: DUF4037 domain-containing protein [Clostridia bacterium]|nr:DUF4037 domain-containing protein [Clostridia bacterium]